MTFDLVVTISMHFYERCQTKEMFGISDLRREILHLRSGCLFVHQLKPILLNAYKYGLLSWWAFVPVSFCPSGLLSSGLLS